MPRGLRRLHNTAPIQSGNRDINTALWHIKAFGSRVLVAAGRYDWKEKVEEEKGE